MVKVDAKEYGKVLGLEGLEGKLEINWDGIANEPNTKRLFKEKGFEIYLMSPEQLDNVPWRPFSFHSPKSTMRSILRIDPVKEGLKNALKNEPIKITRHRIGNREVFRMSYASGLPLLRDNFGAHSIGYDILNDGLKKLEIRKAEYSWMIYPPIIGAVAGFLIGDTYGYWSEVWKEATYGAIRKSELLYALYGTGLGFVAGLIFDAAVGGFTALKDKLEEPFKRMLLARKLKNAYINRNYSP
jgi:hypothetical protein